jgi:hypothetical protein
MSLTAIQKLVNYLTERFDTGDEIFKALIGDKNAIQILPLTKSADVNTGAIANELEYLMQMSRQTTNGANINNMSAIERDFWEQIIGLLQASHEDISQFIDRILAIIAGPKQSKNGIEQSMLRYTDEVEVIELYYTTAFADTTFADYFEYDTGPLVVTASFAGGDETNALYILIILKKNARLENPAVIRTIVSVLDQVVLRGVKYAIQLID